MFTGIIEETGVIKNIVKNGSWAKLSVKCYKITDDIKIGDSIAVNGVCLTANSFSKDEISFDISYETIDRSSLRYAVANQKVNLERALTLSTRLGGHIVSGHVDCVGKMISAVKIGESYQIGIEYDKDVSRYIAEKGSITVDGISLTVTKNSGGIFYVAVIPHTYKSTTLSDKKNGDLVNIEVDILARYIESISISKKDSLKSAVESMFYMGDM